MWELIGKCIITTIYHNCDSHRNIFGGNESMWENDLYVISTYNRARLGGGRERNFDSASNTIPQFHFGIRFQTFPT